MPRTQLVSSAAFVFTALLASTAPAQAQEIQWRHDYAAARKEATETGRPLLLDFGTEACTWCRKQDATTFRDPKVVKLINERFVAVKLDGNKEARLTAALKIEGFPTLILASADGKVLGRHSGYADVPQFMAFANKAPEPSAPVSRPPGAVAARSDAEEARRIKAQIDADLAALYPGIAAALDR